MAKRSRLVVTVAAGAVGLVTLIGPSSQASSATGSAHPVGGHARHAARAQPARLDTGRTSRVPAAADQMSVNTAHITTMCGVANV